MIKTTKLLLAGAVAVAVTSCGGKTQQTETATTEPVKKLSLTKAPASPAYSDAALVLKSSDVADQDSTFAASFDFEVTNYELGVQTADAAERGIANSGKGQHIHFIVDNGPYSAHYEPSFTKELSEGHHVILAFLSRSYHESVKNPSAYYLEQVTVGNPETVDSVDFDAPNLFYSRPKGTYSGDDTKKLMLDFYLINTTLSPDGNKVKATVNGEEFIITEWAPYYIEGLEKGEVTVKLELIDATGNVIPGPFNVVERKVTLK